MRAHLAASSQTLSEEIAASVTWNEQSWSVVSYSGMLNHTTHPRQTALPSHRKLLRDLKTPCELLKIGLLGCQNTQSTPRTPLHLLHAVIQG